MYRAHTMTVGGNLTRILEAKGLTPSELARRTGLSPSRISDLQSDRYRMPDAPTLLTLAKALECTVGELLVGVDDEYDDMLKAIAVLDGLASMTDTHRQDEVDVFSLDSPHTKQSLPVLYEGEASPEGLSWTEDGTPLFHVEEWGSRPVDIKDPRAYLVIIRGDSMEPYYKRGWRAIVSPNLHVGDGDLVCAHLRSGERLIKIAHRDKTQGGWQLQSWNPAYAARFAPDAEVSMIHKVAYVRTMK